MTEPLIFDLSSPGRKGYSLPALDVPETAVPADIQRKELPLPEVSEIDVVRHFTRLSQLNYAIDKGFYPLGSCTMKYNSKINEDVARLPGFARIHPYQPLETVQGALELMFSLQTYLAEMSGFAATSLQPAAGAHGEYAGILCIRAYHHDRGDFQRTKIIVPDSAHGTNPATAAMCGFEVVTVHGDARGNVNVEELRKLVGPDTAGMMLTNPNTLGLFDENIEEVTSLVHEAGGLMYGDGANLNAILGIVKPGHIGFDVLHFNLHKTMSTPHGGGGPGAGPIAVGENLAPYLPSPIVTRKLDGTFTLSEPAKTVGKLRSFAGSFGVLVRAYNYIRMHGAEGLKQNSLNAVTAANYLMHRLKGTYDLGYDRVCMHEFVLSGKKQKLQGARTLDIAKRLIDFGYHPPTIYFPLIVDEAIMIEPTETESIETLDAFAEAMLAIAKEVEEDPQLVHNAPYNSPVTRLDEVTAARKPNLRWVNPAATPEAPAKEMHRETVTVR